MKATTSGQTVGIALEPFDGTNASQCSSSTSSETKCGKILVFVNLGYSKLDTALTAADITRTVADCQQMSASCPQGSAATAWSVDQQSGKVNVGFFGDLNLNGNSIPIAIGASL